LAVGFDPALVSAFGAVSLSRSSPFLPSLDSLHFFGDAASAAIILVVLVLSITLDLAQEHKAERAVDRLRQSVAIMVDVLRSGQLAQVASEAIVPGDVVRLKAADLIPADGLILSEANAHANETVLTGRPTPPPNAPAIAPPL
jgi:P-type Mg2+ transporter